MLTLYGQSFSSRLLLGTAQYPSPESLKQAVKASGAEIVTVSLRRESARALTGQGFWALIEELGCRVLPNTAGCRTAKEAIATAQMARELFGTDWIKLEVIANDDTLQPDLFGLVEAAAALSASASGSALVLRQAVGDVVIVALVGDEDVDGEPGAGGLVEGAHRDGGDVAPDRIPEQRRTAGRAETVPAWWQRRRVSRQHWLG